VEAVQPAEPGVAPLIGASYGKHVSPLVIPA
jgi:hypothetical protein